MNLYSSLTKVFRRARRAQLSTLLAIAAAGCLAGEARAVVPYPHTCATTTTVGNERWDCSFEVYSLNGTLDGDKAYKARIKVAFQRTGPLGVTEETGYAFWDGRRSNGRDVFRFRHIFDNVAANQSWTWTTSCDDVAGDDTCGNAVTSTPLQRTGTVTVVPRTAAQTGTVLNQRGLLSAKTNTWSTPSGVHSWTWLKHGAFAFSWVGDTAWAGPTLATGTDWVSYLDARKNQGGVNLIQVGVLGRWPGVSETALFTQVAGCTGSGPVPNNCSVPNDAFWQTFDLRIQQANTRGFYVLLTGLMEPLRGQPCVAGGNNGFYPYADVAVRFARYLAARLSGNFVIFSPSFDSPAISRPASTGGDPVSLQRAVGEEIERIAPRHLVTNHWNATSEATISTLHADSWLDFEAIQSGFATACKADILGRARTMSRNISASTASPPFNFGNPRKAAANVEAVYDQGNVGPACGATGHVEFNQHRARQAAYLSWVSGAMGVSWGFGGIWDWGICGNAANACWCGNTFGGSYTSAAAAVNVAGKNDIVHLANLKRAATTAINYYQDSFEQSRITNNGTTDPQVMAVARNVDRMWAYLPYNSGISLDLTASNMSPATAVILNPRTGAQTLVAPASSSGNVYTWNNPLYSGSSDQTSDAVLLLRRPSAPPWGADNLLLVEGVVNPSEPWGLYGYQLDGAGQPTGAPFAISAVDAALELRPAAAVDSAGNHLVVWQKDSDGNGLDEIWGRRIFASFASPSTEFQISPAGGSHLAPAVAADGSGDAVIAWVTVRPETGATEVWARSLDGATLGTPLQLCGGEGKECSQVKAGAGPTANASIAWVEKDLATEETRVMVQHFDDVTLYPARISVQANTVAAQDFWLGGVTVDAALQTKVSYEGRSGPVSTGFFAQAYGSSFAPVGTETSTPPIAPEN